MTITNGISKSGKLAEELFLSLTGASKSDRSKDGDAFIEGIGFLNMMAINVQSSVEIKSLDANDTGTTTLNQVRANKYIPLVVYHHPKSEWYVVPAHIVVALVAHRGRGQHGANPIENSTLALKHIGEYRLAQDADLRQKVLDACAEDESFARLKQALNKQVEEVEALAIIHKAEILSILEENRLTN
jgi:hypothetical protein